VERTRRRPPDTNPFTTVPYFTIELKGSSAPCRLIFDGRSGEGTVHQQGAELDRFDSLERFPVPQAWSHVEVDIDRGASSYSVVVDGAPAFQWPDGGSRSQPLGATCLPGNDAVDIYPGMHCLALSNEPREVHLDNLLVTMLP
jgi:hypothetical protein